MTSRLTLIRHLTLALLVGLLGFLVPAQSAWAAESDHLNWVIGCEGFTSVSGGLILNRDNTGEGREAFTIRATDGIGNVIFRLTDSSYVGEGVYIAGGSYFHWSLNPVANPITLTVTSLAGNQLPAEVVYSVTGECNLLTTVATSGSVVISSPSVDLNVEPPRPGADIARLPGAGYLLVDRVTANLRSGDGTQYTVVARVEGSTRLSVLGVNQRRTWWYVQVGEITGWINGDLVIIRGDLTNVPVVEPQGEILLPRLFLYRNNNIRLSPGAGSIILCNIGGGQEYSITGKNRDGSWLRVQATCNDRAVMGWIRAEFGAIRNSGDLAIPVIR